MKAVCCVQNSVSSLVAPGLGIVQRELRMVGAVACIAVVLVPEGAVMVCRYCQDGQGESTEGGEGCV